MHNIVNDYMLEGSEPTEQEIISNIDKITQCDTKIYDLINKIDDKKLQNEFDRTINETTSKYIEVYFEIGLKAGARLLMELLKDDNLPKDNKQSQALIID